ncbi:MAG: RNA polymerase sigma factor FliA [Myxococcales bacterium]|nr:RNA polymerase sigma factor FliA [Myxococcales bacterium]
MSVAALPRPGQQERRAFTRDDYERFLPMVRRIAMRLARRVPRHITINDLIGAGWVGLAEALSRSPATMPQNELEAYASHRVKGAMLDYLRSFEPNAREMRNASRRLARAIAGLEKQFGRPPNETEIAKALDMDVEEYRSCLQRLSIAGMAHLEMVEIDHETLESKTIGPEAEVMKRSLSEAVAEAIPTLPERLQQLLALYYQEECSLKEVGAVLGVSESRVCQLHTEAIHRLRAAIGRD